MINAVSLFCEDIRQEVAGTMSLIGVLPENVEIDTVPSNFSKLGILTRISVSSDQDVQAVALTVTQPDGTTQVVSEAGKDVWGEAVEKARREGAPMYGILMMAVAINFSVPSFGRYLVHTIVDGQQTLTGYINIKPRGQ